MDNIFNEADRSVEYTQLPRVPFASPAVGAVGLTERELIARHKRCECRVLPLKYVPRALVNRDTRGFIKLVVDADTGVIVGLTAVAKDTGEIAATVEQVAHSWAPYLTMAEGIKIAAPSFTTDVSKLSCCAS